ncbi:MAG: DsbA family protein [Anaerolineae bacterium]
MISNDRPESGARGFRFTTLEVILIALLALLLGGIGGYVGRSLLLLQSAPAATAPAASAPAAPGLGASAPAASQSPQSSLDMKQVLAMVLARTRHFKGNPNAPVTIVEFADFQCPFCGRFFNTTEGPLEAKYVTDGTVRFAYLHLAFLGDESQWAALASECADEQGKFWEYHDKLFKSQNGENQGAFAKDNLKKFAVDLGLDAAKFNDCFDSGKYTSIVQAETQLAQQLNIQSTPTFLVNTTPVQGAQPYDTFATLIEQAKKGQ